MSAQSKYIPLAYNGFLVGVATYALCRINFEAYPLAYAASVIGCTHGVLGMINAIFSNGKKENNCKQANVITSCLVEVTSLQLVNMELYLKSPNTSMLGLGHAGYLLPLTVDVAFCIWNNEMADEIQAIKELTVIGTIASLAFVAFNENNLFFGKIAIMAFIAKCARTIMDYYNDAKGEGVNVMSNAGFLYFCAQALK